ncbi:MAG: bifunctional (p)ppGpp synthetase/guanosine-3',5'-bis(diphosphate) 3'-pyrophosphohydrolase [Oscillospiraceae bacterium]|nr:bifunctional (p)ppGpp synthetase/guanosine-3',5'-bis(diphosphate) 3'-pyrophosphohydrolase [Oscillospiraceae bacterium]
MDTRHLDNPIWNFPGIAAVLVQFEDLLSRVLSANPGANEARIWRAFAMATEAHGEQLRKDGSLFISHPIAAAQIIVDMGLDEDSICAALLHDVLEDTEVTAEEIEREFGPSVTVIVEGVTKLTRVQYTSKEEEQMENLRKMLIAMARDIRVILIKFADRLHNMRTMEYQVSEKQVVKASETMEIYAPIAHRLGMQKIKWEFEDLAFYYIDRPAHDEITRDLDSRRGVLDVFMADMQKKMTRRFRENHIDGTVFARLKHIYSIYRKMYTQKRTFEEVFDLCAFRVIVEDIADCYNVLGHIHDMYKPVPGRFKDYISTPKPNMYQSLHTTVIGEEGIPFEVQIRTWDMHHTAEYGIAAHWKYKTPGPGGKGQAGDEERFAWIRRLLEDQQDSGDAQDFFHDLKIDMFADEAFVFTPRGDVINLPAGATPIDFAYYIHSAVGNRMTGAKCNGRLVPFDHVLQNGDIVEILTTGASHGPSRDWLQIAKSSVARNKIRQWFKKEKRDENILHGKQAFEAEVRRQGLAIDAITRGEASGQILKKLAFGSFEDMYAAIGYGGLTAQKAVGKVREELIHLAKPAKSLVDKINQPGRIERAKPVRGIIVEGVDNVLVKFSRCCSPVPGDEVVGFITRGHGVSVHRTDCTNYLNAVTRPEDKGRWIPVSWADTDGQMYQTGLALTAKDRDGLVLDIATALTAIKVRVRSLSARNTGENAVAFITVEVADTKELQTAINKLSGISGVKSISRSSS